MNSEVIQKYLAERRANEINPETIRLDNIVLRQLSEFLSPKGFNDATKEDVMGFFSKRQETHKAGGIHTYKQKVKMFYRWLYGMEYGSYPECVRWIRIKNPTTKKHGTELPIKPEEILTPSDIKALVNASNHPRDQALIMLLYETAARANRPVNYIIRITTPDGVSSDYISSLEGFKNVGELLVALHSFAREKFYPKNPEELKEVLTAENIKSFVKLKNSGIFVK